MRTHRSLTLAALAVSLTFLLGLFAADEETPAPPPGLVAALKGHKEAVYGVVFTPDGRHVLTASGDPAVRVFESATGKEIKNFSGANAHKQLVLSVAVHPDGNLFATGGSDNTARVWDFPSGKHLREFDLNGEAEAVAVSSDGTKVAGGSKDGSVKIFNAADGKLLHTLGGHDGAVTGLAFSPNGQYLVSSGADRRLRFRSPADGKLLASFGAHSAAVRGVAFSPSNNAAYSAGADGTLKFWSLPPVGSRTFAPLPGSVTAFGLSGDGNQAVAATDKAVRISTVANGATVRDFTGAAGIESVALAPNATLLAAGTADRQLFVWKAQDAKLIRQDLAHAGAVRGVAFNPASNQLLTAGADGRVKRWAMPPEPTRTVSHADPVRAAVTTNGKRLFTAADKVVRAWNLAAPGAPAALERQFTGHPDVVNAVAVSPAGPTLASAGEDGAVRFWNQAKGDTFAVLGAHEGPVVSLGYSPNGQQVLTASSADNSVKLWQVPTAGPRAYSHAGAVTSAALSPDGSRLVTGSDDKQVRLWNLTNGNVERTYTGPALGVLAVAYAPAADRVAAGAADKSLWVWVASSAKEHKKFVGLPEAIRAVALSPDGKYAAAGLADKTARLFDLATGKEVQKFAGHTAAVTAVVITPKGDSVVSAGADGVVHVWGTADGKGKSSVKHGGAVHALTLSKDGTRLASGGADKAVKVWTLADGKLAATIATPAEVQGVSFGPNGERLAVAGADKRARVYGTDGALHEYLGHDGPVTAVAFAPDGKRVLTASADKTARNWQLALLWRAQHVGPVRQALFSPRGDRIVSAGDDKAVRLWNPADGKLVRTIAGHTEPVIAVGINLDSTRLATAGADKTARIWDLNAKVGKDGDKPAATIKLPAAPQSLAFSHNGQRLAVGTTGDKESPDSVIVYDAAGQELQTHRGPARALAFLTDNRTLLAAGPDKTARLIDVNVLAAFDAHAGGVTGVAWHSNGEQAVTGGADKAVKLWNANIGKLVRQLGTLTEPVSAVTFSRDFALVAAAGGKTVRGWAALDGRVAFTLAQPAAVRGLSFNQDRSRIAVAGADGWARVWDLNSKQELQAFRHTGEVRGVAFHPGNNALVLSAGEDKAVAVHTLTAVRVINAGTPLRALAVAVNGAHVLTAGDDGKAKLWNLGNGANERTCLGGEKAATAVAVSRSVQMIASGDAAGRVRVFGYNDAKLLGTFKATGAVRELAFSPDNLALVAACAGGAVQTWNVAYVPGQPTPAEFGKPLQTDRHGKIVSGVAFPAAGAVYHTSSTAGSLRAWKLASESPVRTFPHPNSVNAVAFNPAGTQLATACSDGRLRFFDLAKGAQLRELVAHILPNQTAIYCVAWSPDGKQVATGSQDQSLKVWDATTFALVREFKAYKEKTFEKGHQDAVYAVAFTADGKLLVSAGYDKTIKVWNIADGSVARELVNPGLKAAPGMPAPAHPGQVFVLRFSKDGKQLVSAGGAPGLKGYLALWDFSSGKLLSGRELAVGTIFSLALSPDGKTMALGTGGSVRAPELSQGLVLKAPAAK
jgi:WD40 repeat protein